MLAYNFIYKLRKSLHGSYFYVQPKMPFILNMRKPKGEDLIALILSIACVILSLISMVLHEIVEKV